MATFVYEALDAKGRVVHGEAEAATQEQVVKNLRSVRYTVTRVYEKKDRLAAVRAVIERFQRVPLDALAVFTRQFSVIFSSGVSAVRGIEGLGRDSPSPRLSRALLQIHDDVRGGFSLAKAMARHPDVFNSIYISMIKAGEMSGAMGEILDRLATLLERELGLRKKVAAASTYPVIVFLACVLVTGILMTYVFPTFVALFEGIDVELPWITRSLMFVTQVVRNPLVILLSLGGVGLGMYASQQYFETPLGRRHRDRLLLELPVVGSVVKKVALSRFCRTLGTLLGSGVPMVHALEIVGRASGNEILADIVDEVQIGLKAGMRLSQPLKEYRLFPPMLSQLVAVGEETGNLPILLSKLADFYDMEVEASLEQLTSLLEPLMIFFMGCLVGYVLLAVFIPVYSILGKF